MDNKESPAKHNACKLPSVAARTRHDKFWFHDGSIVINVDKTLFRVHQTLLSTHSDVFAGLFTIPQPKDQDMEDGCCVVQLHDSLDDMVDLLNAIYYPSYDLSILP